MKKTFKQKVYRDKNGKFISTAKGKKSGKKAQTVTNYTYSR
jgi:hypothetical protein